MLPQYLLAAFRAQLSSNEDHQAVAGELPKSVWSRLWSPVLSFVAVDDLSDAELDARKQLFNVRRERPSGKPKSQIARQGYKPLASVEMCSLVAVPNPANNSERPDVIVPSELLQIMAG